MRSTVTVFGASGKVGQQVVKLLTAADYRVVAFVHSNNPFGSADNIDVVSGDIADDKLVAMAIKDSSAVISTLGSWHTKSKDIVSTGTKHIIAAMEARGDIHRIITLTGAAAFAHGDTPSLLDKGSHAFLGIVAPQILRDGEAHLAALEASNLDWTTIRSPAMSKKEATGYRLDMKFAPVYAFIPRAAVAQAMVDQLSSQDFIRKAPMIHAA